jgi:7-carboxy-7-deazaguanine synthase
MFRLHHLHHLRFNSASKKRSQPITQPSERGGSTAPFNKMNNQAQEKKVDSDLLKVHSIFSTIQGEGPFQGEPAIFVRLAGCNLQCPKCDTDYTSNVTGMFAEEIHTKLKQLKQLKQLKNKPVYKTLVVITGGEPFRQNIKSLLLLLSRDFDFYTQIETNGTIEPANCGYNTLGTKRGVSIVVSPKGKDIHPEIHRLACAFKYIINSNHVNENNGLPTSVLGYNFTPAIPYGCNPGSRRIYVIPEDSNDIEQNICNRDAAINSAIKFGYTFQLQVHKLIGLD